MRCEKEDKGAWRTPGTAIMTKRIENTRVYFRICVDRNTSGSTDVWEFPIENPLGKRAANKAILGSNKLFDCIFSLTEIVQIKVLRFTSGKRVLKTEKLGKNGVVAGLK